MPSDAPKDDDYPMDIAFDFRADTPPGKDPDARSPTLRRYHKALWSKPLPNGVMFSLSDTTPSVYLHHRSHLGEFRLASDSAIPSFKKERRLSPVFEKIPEELETFRALTYTIGGMILFPGNRINGRRTINGARGLDHQIKDRFDFTVECIRRYYRNESSPLSATFELYAEFFRLFEDFRGYIEYFLLQDMVSEDFSSVNFFSPFEDFGSPPVPNGLEAYLSYRELAMTFITARNRRIEDWVKTFRGMPKAEATPTIPI